MELDFIGKKFIRERTEPLNFIGFSLRKLCKLKHFRRINGETGDNIIKESERFFKKFEKPDVIKMDNGFAMTGSSSHSRVISKVPLWFLKQQIIPIFAPPKKPWSQSSIEGSNSVFSRKFRNRIDFESIQYVDERLEAFNKNYQWYLGYEPPERKSAKKNFIPKIYFIRKVYENSETEKGYIELSNTKIPLPKSYINFFVLSEWNLKKEKLYVYLKMNKNLNWLVSNI